MVLLPERLRQKIQTPYKLAAAHQERMRNGAEIQMPGMSEGVHAKRQFEVPSDQTASIIRRRIDDLRHRAI